ncbi:MAG TPA: efflux RND transporter periplasmic adaptor subunit [Methylocystis sp.]|nr:efflux RND transporter periplasmic adaptor subunit [Methylocystis sp.]
MASRDPAPAMSAADEAAAADGSDVGPASRQHGFSKTQLFGLAALLLLLSALLRGAWMHYEQHSQAVTDAQKRKSFVPMVQVATVTESETVTHSTWPGTVLGYTQANIFARATGYISTRNVDIGSKVRAGDVLAIIAAPDLDQQLAQARAQLVQMQAAVEQTKSTAELGRITTSRSSKLVFADSVSRQQADNDRLTYASEKAALAVAEANVVAQQAAVDRLVQLVGFERVTAPFDGTVTARFIDVGALVQADSNSGTSLFTMIHSNVIRVQTYVPQDQSFGLTAGVEGVVRVPEMPRRGFPGKVTRVAGALAPGTRTLLAEIDVPNPDGALSAGTYCTVELQIPRKTPSLIVPAGAIIFNQQGLQAAVVQDGVAHLKQIRIVRDFGREVEVSEGVKEGDQVIVSPPVDLQDGAKVQIRTPPPGATP